MCPRVSGRAALVGLRVISGSSCAIDLLHLSAGLGVMSSLEAAACFHDGR